MKADTGDNRLGWIEAGRGLAALAVVVSHYPPVSDYRWQIVVNLGGLGVEFFFLLSGFIIFHVHARDIGQPLSLKSYCLRRLWRIFPPYWVVFLVILVFNQTLQNVNYRLPINPGFLARQLCMLPGVHLLIEPAWTLRHELLFYAMFAVTILHARLGLIVFLIWGLAIVFSINSLGFNTIPTNTAYRVLFHHYNLDFFIGIGIAIAIRRGHETPTMVVASVIAVVFIVIWVSLGFPASSVWQTFGYKAVCTVLLGGACMTSKMWRTPRFLVLLGAASYAIYLFNRNLGFIIGGGFKRAGLQSYYRSPTVFVLSVVFVVSVGILFHLLVEKPFLKWINSRRWALRPSSIQRDAQDLPIGGLPNAVTIQEDASAPKLRQ